MEFEPLIALALGVFLIFSGGFRLTRASGSKTAVEGEVTSCETRAGSEVGNREVSLSYQYRALGVPYTGSATWATSRGAARKFESAHPPGTAVRVFHDPLRPETSMLSPSRERGGAIAMFLFGVGSLAFALSSMGLFD